MTARRGHGEGGIRRRQDGRWEATVDLGWSDDGKRRRKYVYGRTRADVAEKLRVAQSANDMGQLVLDSRRTTESFLTWWSTTVLPGTVGHGSAETYGRTLKLYVIPSVGRTPLVKLTPAHVTEMMRSMEAKGLSSSTQNQARKVLARALRRANQEGLVFRNVAQLADGPRVRHEEGRAMTGDQARTFLQSISADRLAPAFILAIVLGLRRGELLGLRWPDVDLDAEFPMVKVRQQLQRHTGDGLVLVELKTPKSRRDLVLPAQAAAALRSWRADQARERLTLGPAWQDSRQLVFTTPIGTPLDPDNFRHRLAKLTQAAGLGRWRTHELRKSTGSLLFEQGVPMKLISETLGHSSERVTSDIYVKPYEAAKARVAAGIADAIWPAASEGGTLGGQDGGQLASDSEALTS